MFQFCIPRISFQEIKGVSPFLSARSILTPDLAKYDLFEMTREQKTPQIVSAGLLKRFELNRLFNLRQLGLVNNF
jgi:hypothetical protein